MKVDVVADAGNSFIKWGRCAGGRVTDIVALSQTNEVEWQQQMLDWSITDTRQWAVAGSAPERRDRFAQWLGEHKQRAHVFNSYAQLPIQLNVRHPDKVGLDRLLNGVAVNTRRPEGVAAIVIDAGTAVTVDYLDEGGVFQGGAILPGLKLMARLLHEHTAALPMLDADSWQQPLPTAPGKTTVEAMRLGMTAAVLGGVERLARHYATLTAGRVVVFFGGGDAAMMATGAFPGDHQLWPEMTLEGIRLTAEGEPGA